VWPGKTAMVVAAIIAIYAIAAGLVYAGLGIFAAGKGGWSRVGHVLLGVLFIIAGIVAPRTSARRPSGSPLPRHPRRHHVDHRGRRGAVDARSGPSRGWMIFYAIISLIAGAHAAFPRPSGVRWCCGGCSESRQS
jgi:uncharacterized membrane protein HdeD (DUF308 family)